MKFTIDHITKRNQRLIVEVSMDGGEGVEVIIDVTKFYRWLEVNDRLGWVSDTVDHRGEHVQKTGKYTDAPQFWRLSSEETREMSIMDYIDSEMDIEDEIKKKLFDEYKND